MCACIHIGVGFGVACSDTKAIPEPQIAEQQQCSPAFFMQMPCVCVEAEHYLASDRFFCVLLLSMSNFSLDVQGILRTSRYEEKLLVDLVTDSKRTNKNQSVSCPTNIKALPLQSKETAKLTSNNYGETRNYIKSHV